MLLVVNCDALTVTELEAPVMLAVAVSVALTVWLAAVKKVTANVPRPPVNFVSAGNAARASLLVKCTVPA
jgi:hypothetical protein